MSELLQHVSEGDRISAEQHNLIVDSVRRRLTADSGSSAMSDTTAYHVRRLVSRSGGALIVQLRVLTVKDDYLECVTWDGIEEGTDTLRVAKPYLLRKTTFDGKTRNGVEYTYDATDSQKRIAKRLADLTEREEEVHPRYVTTTDEADDPNNDLIYAELDVVGGTNVVVTNDDDTIESLVLIDIGNDGRHFHSDQDFGRTGIVWLTIGFPGDTVILILNPTNFCICCEFATPGLNPTGVGGDSDQMWHCDEGTDKAYSLSTSTLAFGDGVTTPGLRPSGIGGTKDVVWLTDSHVPDKGLYELDPETLGVIRGPALNDQLTLPLDCGGDETIIYLVDDVLEGRIKRISPISFNIVNAVQSPELTPTGIGGDLDVVWHCDADNSFIFELEPPLMGVIRTKKSPREVPQGIGGKSRGRSGCG